METIKLNGKEYPLDWTFMSEEYIELAAEAMKKAGNIGKAAIMAVAALRGGNYLFDKGPDWVLNAVGKDGKKMNELSEKIVKVLNEFNALNRNEENLEAKSGNVESPQVTEGRN